MINMLTSSVKLLDVVALTVDRKDITRLISARPATRKERKAYESEL